MSLGVEVQGTSNWRIAQSWRDSQKLISVVARIGAEKVWNRVLGWKTALA